MLGCGYEISLLVFNLNHGTFPSAFSQGIQKWSFIASKCTLWLWRSSIPYLNLLLVPRFCVVGVMSCTKSNQSVARLTVVLLIANDTNSDFRTITLTTKGIESFLVTVALLVGVAANQLFHPSRVSEVLRYWPSAISECREAASLLMTMNLSVWLIFISRQILEKDVFQ